MGFLRKLLCRPKKAPVGPAPLTPAVPEKASESIISPMSRRKPVASISSTSLEVTPKQTPLPIPAQAPPIAPASVTIVPAPVNSNPAFNGPTVLPFNGSPDSTRIDGRNDVNDGLGLDTCNDDQGTAAERRDLISDGVADCKDNIGDNTMSPTVGVSNAESANGGDTITSPATITEFAPASGGDTGCPSFGGGRGDSGGGGGGGGDSGGGSSGD